MIVDAGQERAQGEEDPRGEEDGQKGEAEGDPVARVEGEGAADAVA